MGEGYIKVAEQILAAKNSGDCAAFAGMFAEHGNFSVTCTKRNFTKELQGSAQMEQMCQMHQQHRGEHGKKVLQLKSVFPAFHTGDAMFEVQAVTEDGTIAKTGLWSGHYCEKQQKVMRAKIIMGASEDMPAAIRTAGESFLRKVQEAGDCSTVSEGLEGAAAIETYGEPGKLVFGDWHHSKEEPAMDVASFQKACEGRVSKEKRIHKSVKLAISTTYYDAAQRELTIIAQKEVVTIFRAEPITKPVAVVLRFSAAGKIEKARFYETEVMHLEAKWASTYGHPAAAAEESHLPFLAHLQRFGRFVAQKVGAVPAQEKEGEHKKEWAGKWAGKMEEHKEKWASKWASRMEEHKEKWAGKWAGKMENFEKRMENMPEELKHKKCEWLAKKQAGEWAKEKPWFKAMEKMCAELKFKKEGDLEKLPEDIKQKKCDWFALKHETKWAKEQPWFAAMEEMCSHIKREPLPLAPKPLNGMVVLSESTESSSARGLSLALSQVAAMVLGLGLAHM